MGPELAFNRSRIDWGFSIRIGTFDNAEQAEIIETLVDQCMFSEVKLPFVVLNDYSFNVRVVRLTRMKHNKHGLLKSIERFFGWLGR